MDKPTSRRQASSSTGQRSLRRALTIAAAAALLASTVLVGLAAADTVSDTQQQVQSIAQDPGSAGPSGTTDTQATPVAGNIHEAAQLGWSQVAGAIYPTVDPQQVQADMGYSDLSSQHAPGSVPHSVDFFTVAFRNGNPDDGFAGGAACKDSDTADDQLDSCPRVPVIYQFSKVNPTDPPNWHEVFRGDSQGYVGAIAWLPENDANGAEGKAVAVGGDGCYPRREVADAYCKANPPPSGGDPLSGKAKAWEFQDGSWGPITGLSGTMTGLTSLAFSPRVPACRGAVDECGLAGGGMGQIWMWRDGAFDPTPSYPDSVQRAAAGCLDTTAGQCDSPFRVRSVAFNPYPNARAAFAVTSGCCSSDPSNNFARLLDLNAGKWEVGGIYANDSVPAVPQLQSLPDTVYDVVFTGTALTPRVSVVMSPGSDNTSPAGTGPAPVESPSRVIGPLGFSRNHAPTPSLVSVIPANDTSSHSDVAFFALQPQLTSARLVAGDGDVLDHRRGTIEQAGGFTPAPDGIADWAVGQLRSTGQALAFTSAERVYTLAQAPYPISCPEASNLANFSPACQLDTQAAEQLKSKYLYMLPSYPLNDYTAVGQSGVSWAAGDRGALVRLGGSTAAGQGAGAAKPPKLGGGQTTRLSNREGYDAFRPVLSTEPGLVPPLAAQPASDLTIPRLTPTGSPNPHPAFTHPEGISSIAMSRDGSEGWAVGPSQANGFTATTTLYHFNGVRWTKCDPKGTPGLVPPDPACAGLAELSAVQDQGAKLLSMARIPLENGDDASRADDFEAVALALYPNGNVAFVRYANGQWRPVDEWSGADMLAQDGASKFELAFRTPDDGWLIGVKGQQTFLYHLVSGAWIKCSGLKQGDATTAKQRADCGSPDAVLPTMQNAQGVSDNANVTGFVSGLHFLLAGKRLYIYGTRAEAAAAGTRYPVILYEDGKDWKQSFDPKNGVNEGPPDQAGTQGLQGILNSLSIVPNSDGAPDSAWGLGEFTVPTGGLPDTGLEVRLSEQGHTPLLTWDSGTHKWKFDDNPGPAASEYLLPETLNQQLAPRAEPEQVLALPGANGEDGPVIATPTLGGRARPLVWRNPASQQWEVFPVPYSYLASTEALAPDNRGGAWLTVRGSNQSGSWFYHYTRHVNRPVFSDVPHPIRQPIAATSAGGDGSLWVATTSGTVYRYDRLTGWDQVNLKGWDSGGAVQAPAYAIAVGQDGNGIVVGKNGRIADVGPQGANLDPAALVCSSQPDSCGGGHTLRAAAVAPGGSALAGGDARTLLYRPANGSFNRIDPPPAASGATITGISMPSATEAWLTTDTGDVFAGTGGSGGWSWSREDVNVSGRVLTSEVPLRGIAIDGDRHGYAVGDHGMILERVGGAWKRLVTGYGENLRSVTIGPGGRGALIGGEGGLVLTLADGHFEVAQASDYFNPATYPIDPDGLGTVVGVALLPGSKAGDVEAWAAEQLPPITGQGRPNRTPAPGLLLHYTNDSSDPMLAAGAGRAEALPDTRPHRDGEVDFAAFGKSDCQQTGGDVCPEFTGSANENEEIARRIRDALLDGDQRPDFAVFTGDVNDTAGARNRNLVDGPTDASVIHERWSELIANPFGRAGIPLYGAIGGQDLSNTQACDALRTNCVATHQTRTGLNLAWRQAFANADGPWGGGSVKPRDGLEFRAADCGDSSLAGTSNGARTHYAFDVWRGGRKLVRVAVVDTSLKTLAGSAAVQNPAGDQLTWLNDVLGCVGNAQKIVVSETPSYTYGSTGATTDTLADSAAFEALLVKNQVTAVVSGRLGWNGLSWLLAPGLHSPCPGGSYQPDPPTDPSQLCTGSGAAVDNADKLAAKLQGNGVDVPTPSTKLRQLTGGVVTPIPIAVAASAGGKFGPDGSGAGSATQGFWHGYTRIRLFPGTDGGTEQPPLIEQRPVFDWIGIQANDHTIAPGHRLQLKGYGREPIGADQPARYDDINGPAVTHRFYLFLADRDRPYLPQADSTTETGYAEVPPDIGASIDRQTGEIAYSGNGNHPPVYALAVLSVGTRSATWPVILAPRRSFRPPPPPLPQRIILPPRPKVEAATPAQIPPTPATPIPKPPNLNLTFPQPPSLPNLSLNAPQAQPPAPPAPPPPPASPAATALQITPAPVGLNVAPPATVIPPPAPPIQPAPPSGARREARQKQAAVAKSEEGGSEESATQESGAENGNGGESASTRLEPRREDPYAFTAAEHHDQPSAWTRDLMYGGGLGLGALVLALGWSLMRPGPRRREPELPAPAWARMRNRR